MVFELPKLSFDQDALDPYMSGKTLQFHYGKHHQTYVNNLNNLIKGTELETENLENIILKSAGKDDKIAIFNNAAQAWNHAFFWSCLTANGGGALPDGAFKKAVFGGNWERVKSDPLNNSVSLETPTGNEDLTLMDMLVDPISEMDYRLVEEMDYWHSVATVIQEAIFKIPNPTSRNILELECHNKISHKRGASILNLAYDKYIYYYNEGKRALRRIIPALINRDRDKYELMEYIESSPFYSGSVSAWKGRSYTSSTESAALKLMQLEESIKLNNAIIEPAN